MLKSIITGILAGSVLLSGVIFADASCTSQYDPSSATFNHDFVTCLVNAAKLKKSQITIVNCSAPMLSGGLRDATSKGILSFTYPSTIAQFCEDNTTTTEDTNNCILDMNKWNDISKKDGKQDLQFDCFDVA